MRRLAAALVAGLALVPAARAQDATAAQPVLIVDSDQIYLQSEYGQQIRADLDAQAAALKAENDKIVATLTEEERSLTQRRPSLTPEAFRAEATAFDVKVQGIRQARDAKEQALQDSRVAARDDFFNAVRDVLGQLMVERGASVIVDRRSVFLALATADLTDEAIARIDDRFVADGANPDAPPLPLIEGPTDNDPAAEPPTR